MSIVRPTWIIASLLAAAPLFLPADAHAGRGGFRGGGGMGGFRGGMPGGMGGFRGGMPGGMGNMGGFRGGMPGGMGNMGGFRGNMGGVGNPGLYRGGNMGMAGGAGRGLDGGLSSFNRMPSFGTSHTYGSGYNGLRGAGGLNPYAGGAGIGNRGFNNNNIAIGNRTNIGIAAGNRGYGWRDNGYARYHAGWVHGYWPGHYAGWGWGYGGGWGLGYGYGYAGLATAWALGSGLYSNWGYTTYADPYYTAGAGSYNYSQPIDTTAAAPDASVADPAVATFDQAREAFRSGDYATALADADAALKAMPGDTDIHEFRAITLFALGRYDEAAAGLYGVLSAGPGWDWTTLSGLYADPATFTTQQRALEDAIRAQPNSAPPRFVLAYLYLAEGENDAATDQLKAVVSLQPDDRVSAALLQSIASSSKSAPAPEAAPADPTPPAQAPAPDVNVAGTWTARPSAGTTITLAIAADGAFTWTVVENGQSHAIEGKSNYGDGVLTLVPDGGGAPMVGNVAGTASGFTFQALGGGPSDPGLAFAKAS